MSGRILALLVAALTLLVGCDAEEVNQWRVEHGLAPLPAADAAAVADYFDAVVAELERRASFVGEVHTVSAGELGSSWRQGCPVGPGDLRLLVLSYHGFDGVTRQGEMVVHRDQASAVVAVFRVLFEEKFPIRSMRTVDEFDSDDDASMAADNTSGFNCRTVKGTSSWSRHAFGRAIDINPVENPYVIGWAVDPPAGYPFADRSNVRPGMISDGDIVVRTFRNHGWSWGGYWSSGQDYQHFSVGGG